MPQLKQPHYLWWFVTVMVTERRLVCGMPRRDARTIPHSHCCQDKLTWTTWSPHNPLAVNEKQSQRLERFQILNMWNGSVEIHGIKNECTLTTIGFHFIGERCKLCILSFRVILFWSRDIILYQIILWSRMPKMKATSNRTSMAKG